MLSTTAQKSKGFKHCCFNFVPFQNPTQFDSIWTLKMMTEGTKFVTKRRGEVIFQTLPWFKIKKWQRTEWIITKEAESYLKKSTVFKKFILKKVEKKLFVLLAIMTG